MKARNYKRELKTVERELEAAIQKYEEAVNALPKGSMTESAAKLGWAIYVIDDKIKYLREQVLFERLKKIEEDHKSN